MNTTPSETTRMTDAVAGLFATITEIIDAKLKKALETHASLPNSLPANPQPPKAIEGWVKKKDVAKHLNVSLRSVDNWISSGMIPYVRLGGRRLLFKLSDVDEAINRRFKRNARWGEVFPRAKAASNHCR